MSRAYYNEIDPFAAQWLRNLIGAGLIAPGDVDERSIADVRPDDLAGYTQCHFFAGIGVWSHALRAGGWPDDRPVWTGSCPCQPFSGAGKGGGFADERHLWPPWFYLIEECRPGIVFGEQVASPDGLSWLDLVQADLEGAGYAFGSADLCAAGVGAPHIRQRLYFVADAVHAKRGTLDEYREDGRDRQNAGREKAHGKPGTCGEVCELANSMLSGRVEWRARPGHGSSAGERSACRMADTSDGSGVDVEGTGTLQTGSLQPLPISGFWIGADWLLCRDGKLRPVEPGTFPLANGAPSRVGRLRAYGNAIVAPLAAEFVKSFMQVDQP